jgi:hypothetical protein
MCQKWVFHLKTLNNFMIEKINNNNNNFNIVKKTYSWLITGE